MAGQRRPANKPRPQPRDNGYGAPQGQKGYGKDATYQMHGGQLTVGNKSGARSWLGHPTATQTGNEVKYDGSGVMPVQLANMGKAKNGFEQFGYVPTGEQGQAGSQQFGRTPYAMPGMDRAGAVTTQGWNPKGAANTKTWNAMQAAIEGGPQTGGHMEFGQKGQDTRQGTRGHNSQGGLPGQGVPGDKGGGGFQTDVRPNGQPIGTGGGGGGGFQGGGAQQGGRPGGGGGKKKGGGGKGPLPNMPPKGGGMAGGVGEFPKMPTPPANFLPMTPGYEQDWRGLNDQLGAAEGQFAQGQAMLPAQYNLMNTRIQNDQDLATKRLNEDLAGRGVYTAKNAAGTYGGTSPSGGGVGESMYSRNVATPGDPALTGDSAGCAFAGRETASPQKAYAAIALARFTRQIVLRGRSGVEPLPQLERVERQRYCGQPLNHPTSAVSAMGWV